MMPPVAPEEPAQPALPSHVLPAKAKPEAHGRAPAGNGAGQPGDRGEKRGADVLSSQPAQALTAASIEQGGADMVGQWRRSVAREAASIEIAASAWARAYRLRAGFFLAIGTYLALGSAVVATVAGATGFTLPAQIGAVLALSAAMLVAISSTVGAPTRTERERLVGAKNWTLAAEARVFRTTVARYGSPEEVLDAFRQLCKQRDEVWSSAPVEGRRTQRQVDHAIDEKVGTMMPEDEQFSEGYPFGYLPGPRPRWGRARAHQQARPRPQG